MKTVLKQGSLDVTIDNGMQNTEKPTGLNDPCYLTESHKNFRLNYPDETLKFSNRRCEHSGPHGSRYHGQRGGGWCYWCYICNPGNPKAY